MLVHSEGGNLETSCLLVIDNGTVSLYSEQKSALEFPGRRLKDPAESEDRDAFGL